MRNAYPIFVDLLHYPSPGNENDYPPETISVNVCNITAIRDVGTPDYPVVEIQSGNGFIHLGGQTREGILARIATITSEEP
jgi:hypothetical protein